MKVVVKEITQPAPDEEDATIAFKGIPPGRGQAIAKLFSDLGQALADGKLDLIEDLQLAIDVKAIVKP